MKPAVRLLTVALLSGFLVTSPASGPSGASSLPLGSFSDIVVDPVHGKVFVSGGSVVVAGLDGAVTGTVSGIAEARQMTMSPDGNDLVVANGDGLTVVDATTGVVDRTIATGNNSCPDAVAVASSLVFYSYGDCSGGTPGLGALDLTGDTLTTGLDTGSITVQSARLAAASAAPHVLALTTAAGMAVLDTSGGENPATTVRHSWAIGGVRDVALDPEGSKLAIAGPATSQVRVLSTTDFNSIEMTPYSKSGTSNSLAVRADGVLATGYARDLADAYTYNVVGGTGRGALDLALPDERLAPRGLAFGENRLYGVIASAGSYRLASGAADGPADIRIAADKHIYPYGATATVSIALRSPTISTKVSLWANTPGHSPHLVKVTSVDPVSRKVTLKVPSLTRNITFTAKFGGDDKFTAGSAAVAVLVRFKITITSASKSMSGPYHRLPASPAPVITGRLSPAYQGVCVTVGADVKDGSLWNIGSVKCLRTSSTGRVGVRLIGFPRGTRVRIVMKVGRTSTNYDAYVATYYVVLT